MRTFSDPTIPVFRKGCTSSIVSWSKRELPRPKGRSERSLVPVGRGLSLAASPQSTIAGRRGTSLLPTGREAVHGGPTH
jgi:hypothetical protein